MHDIEREGGKVKGSARAVCGRGCVERLRQLRQRYQSRRYIGSTARLSDSLSDPWVIHQPLPHSREEWGRRGQGLSGHHNHHP